MLPILTRRAPDAHNLPGTVARIIPFPVPFRALATPPAIPAGRATALAAFAPAGAATSLRKEHARTRARVG